MDKVNKHIFVGSSFDGRDLERLLGNYWKVYKPGDRGVFKIKVGCHWRRRVFSWGKDFCGVDHLCYSYISKETSL